MSKFNLTEFVDKDITPTLLSPLVDEFLKITKEIPTAIVITPEQWGKFFYQSNEKLTNFRGIPLETPAEANKTELIVKTINSILSGMHTAGVKEASDVYRLLENMKEKLK